MLPGKARILQELQGISKKWFTSREDSIRLSELLRELAHLDGYRAPTASVTDGWLEERTYGLEEIARLESPEAVSLLVALVKKEIGVMHEEGVDLLANMNHPAALEGLRDLTRFGRDSQREAARAALQRKTALQ